MQDLAGKCAVITGGGGLLGRGMALAFAREGMDVVLADLRLEAAEAVAEAVRATGRRAKALAVDVSDAEAMEAMADAAFAAFGDVHLLCNNAGGALIKPYEDLTKADWDRVLGSNLMGVINGNLAFVKRFIAAGGERHIVNTASMSGVGLASLRQSNAIYVTSKFAVVGMTEAMAPALEKYGIGVSVLCPGMTVADPAAPLEHRMPSSAWYGDRDNVLGPAAVADEVVRGVREKRLHIFPHHAGRAEVEARQTLLLRGFDQADGATGSAGGGEPRSADG
jgi:NAD(P)-dependent dehydrogenase (short-subunit alcohol dehydrogenase family)